MPLAGCKDDSPRPNVVLAVLDTTRADAVSSYGSPPGTTPTVEELARSGVQYEYAYANANWTVPSHATLFTGLLPSTHGLIGGDRVLGPVQTLAGILGAAGYETVGISENPWLRPGNGLARDFETYHGRNRRPIPEVAARWLAKRDTKRPFFLFLNIMDAHSPYQVRSTNPFLPAGVDRAAARAVPQDPHLYLCRASPSDPAIEILHGLYLGDVRAADEKLASILHQLEPLRRAAPLIVVVTSDHGEHFGENDLIEHHVGVDNVLLHVPLIVNGLPRVPPAHIRAAVQLADVMPSILTWVGLPVPPHLAGVPLPTAEPRVENQRALVSDFYDLEDETLAKVSGVLREKAAQQWQHCDERDRVHGDMRSVIRFPYKLKWYALYPPQLYDLRNDPAETNDLAAQRPDLVAALKEDLDTMLAATRATAPVQERKLSPAEIERLRALGYLGGPDRTQTTRDTPRAEAGDEH